jgi:hypothetical protein
MSGYLFGANSQMWMNGDAPNIPGIYVERPPYPDDLEEPLPSDTPTDTGRVFREGGRVGEMVSLHLSTLLSLSETRTLSQGVPPPLPP